MRYLVTGGAGFIGSHMVDRLVAEGHQVNVLDSLSTGNIKNLLKQDPDVGENGETTESIPSAVTFYHGDIRNLQDVLTAMIGCDGVFHFAAIARTPWTIEDPVLAMETNVIGTTNVLEAARRHGTKRVILSSSSVVYAAETPYKASKMAGEMIARAYEEMYGMSILSFRYSNVYGPRQSEEGPSPNVFAALRKTKRETGKVQITGDGEQTRAYTHVSDIVEGNLLAMNSDCTGVLDLTTGVYTSMNEVAKLFNAEIVYIPERKGDIKHIKQDSTSAKIILGWEAKVKIEDGIKDVL